MALHRGEARRFVVERLGQLAGRLRRRKGSRPRPRRRRAENHRGRAGDLRELQARCGAGARVKTTSQNGQVKEETLNLFLTRRQHIESNFAPEYGRRKKAAGRYACSLCVKRIRSTRVPVCCASRGGCVCS